MGVCELERRLRRKAITADSVCSAAWAIVRKSELTDDVLFESLERGVAILEREDQCAKYITAFSGKHFAKFEVVFRRLKEIIRHRRIAIVDWGCGVGLAELAFSAICDSSIVGHIILIEPSHVSSSWAQFLSNRCFPDASTLCICKCFGELEQDDFGLMGCEGCARVHIFSNVFDIDSIRRKRVLEKFADKFSSFAWREGDLVVLISPTYHQVEVTLDRFVDAIRTKTKVLNVYKKVITEENVKAIVQIVQFPFPNVFVRMEREVLRIARGLRSIIKRTLGAN